MWRALLAAIFIVIGGAAHASQCPLYYSIGTVFKYNSGYPTKYGNGDGYWPTWADDGNLYVSQDDSLPAPSGFQGSQTATSNFNIGSLNGYTSALTGTTINPMAAWGTAGFISSAGYNWKTGALLSVGSTLYAAISQGIYTNGAGVNPWQPALQSQIIKSTDHGVTWHPTTTSTGQAYPTGTTDGYPTPMFPNQEIGGFIQYGQAYTGQTVDNSATYVYEYFVNNVLPNVGSSIFLGRVSLANLPNLKGSDWAYYQGGDGMSPGNWGAYSTAATVLAVAEPAGQMPRLWWFNPQYMPAFGCYVAIPASWPGSASTTTLLQIWTSPKPWGPWTQVGVDYDTTPSGLYGVNIAPNSVVPDGGLTSTLMAGGDWQAQSPSTGNYTLHLLPMTLGPPPNLIGSVARRR
jgi:hypothetical protein